jgi:uncharacterized cofD-like protein
MKVLKLLYPGMHLKRWILVLMIGLLVLVLGAAYVLVEIYRSAPLPEEAFWVTLQFLPRPVRAALFVLGGVGLIAWALWKLNRSLIDALAPGQSDIVEAIYNFRARQRGPKVVAIGGGTGLSMLLRGLKDYTSNITAIVTVADDGGSSGRLRRELGMLPPGDFRNCLVALADVEPLMGKLFQYRFNNGTALDGHSFGNLFIVAMMGVTGSFERALRESSRVLAVRGQVLPSTLENVNLCAEMEDEALIVVGESKITETGSKIRRLSLQPEHPPAYPEAIKAILEADLIVLGPGSLFTSLLPNLLVDGIYRALLASSALRVYVCNVATQRGETDGYGVAEHVAALRRHLPEDPFHYVLANSRTDVTIPERYPSTTVSAPAQAKAADYHVVLADVVDPEAPLRHDSTKLAQALIGLYYEKAAAPPVPPPAVNGASGH